MGAIRDRVRARPELDGLRAARDLDGLAAALNAEGLMAPAQRFITWRGIEANCADGTAILDALDVAAEKDSQIRRAVKALEGQMGLDIGDPFVYGTPDKPGMIDKLVAAKIFLPAWADQIKVLALKPVVVDRLEVEADLYNLDATGSEK